MSTVSSNIRDNHTRGTVADFLREKVHEKADLELVTWLVIKEPDHAC